MDIISSIVGAATTLSSACGQVQAYKKQCQRLGKRVEGLKELVLVCQRADQISDKVRPALRDLKDTLEKAQGVVEKYTNDSFLKRLVKPFTHNDEFEDLNDSLNDVFQVLSLNLQVDNKLQVFELFKSVAQRKENKEDKKEDEEELKILQEMQKNQTSMLGNQGDMMKKLDVIEQNMKMRGNIPSGQDAVDGAERVTSSAKKEKSDAEKVNFVNRHMAVLIQEVTHVKPIVDGLRANGKIHRETYAEISNAGLSDMERMRILNTSVLEPGGRKIQLEFYELLKKEESILLDKIEEDE